MDSMLDVARHIAGVAHAYQVDKAGEPYIEHPRRVAAYVREAGGSQEAQVVAWLHDIIEDSWINAETLINYFPSHIVDAVEAITHPRQESNQDYYQRVKANPLALLVKRDGDIRDNADPVRLAKLSSKDATRLTQKYAEALAALA